MAGRGVTMSAGFKAVQWTRFKLQYDVALLLLTGAYVAIFLYAAPLLTKPGAQVDNQILWMRALGSCAFLMLTIILAIGPLARLDRRFLPLLYNRRHFGVTTALVALAHAIAVLSWYHEHGAISPLLSLLAGNPRLGSFTAFPFELLGLAVLVLLAVMAATSHDFWLAFLTPPVWKAIHMLIYPAYGLLVMHIALGPIESEATPLLPVLAGGGFALVAGLHLVAAQRGRREDAAFTRSAAAEADGDWLDVGAPESIPDLAARIVNTPEGERIAVFRQGGRFSALSNVCAHQNGPLGEGRIVDGCITCPWHGYQYRPEDGCSPPPFTEKVPTFRLRLAAGIVQVDARPLPPGTFVEPLTIGGPR